MRLNFYPKPFAKTIILVLSMLLFSSIVKAEDYGVQVAGQYITDANKDNFTSPSIKSGKVYYNPDTKTLYLNNVNLDCNDQAIYITIPGVTIKVIGECTVSSPSGHTTIGSGIDNDRDYTVDGGGTLNVTQSLTSGRSITIKNVDLTVRSISSTSANNGALTIDGANVDVTTRGEYNIFNFKSITLRNSSITSPANYVYDTTNKYFKVDGKKYTGAITIKSTLTKYDITIAGDRITSGNKDNFKSEYTSGTITFDGDKTLTLDGATIDGRPALTNAIWSSIDRLIIKVKGPNYLYSGDGAAIYDRNSMSIVHGVPTTPCVLNIVSEGRNGGAMYGYNITIKNVKVFVESGNYGVLAAGTLDMQYASMLVVKCPGGACVCAGFKQASSVIVAWPLNASYNADKKAICLSDGNAVTGELAIGNYSVYSVSVGGHVLNGYSYTKLKEFPGVSGNISYSPSSKTLNLNGVTINTPYTNCIRNDAPDLKINVLGTNTLTSSSVSSTLNLWANTEFTGTGTINASGSEMGGMNIANSTVTVSGPTLNLKGKYGITTLQSDHTFVVNSGQVTAEGTTSAVNALNDLQIAADLRMVYPYGGKFDAESKTVLDAYKRVAKKMVIQKTSEYGLAINGLVVNDYNKNDLTRFPWVTNGSISFDGAKTLVLNGVTIPAANGNSIKNISIPELVVKVVGNCKLEAKDTFKGESFVAQAPTTIQGTGMLTINNSEAAAFNLYGSNANLTIKDCDVVANTLRGIDGTNSPSVVIDNATVTLAVRQGFYPILGINSLTLNNCGITEPEGGYFDTSRHIIVDANGERYFDKVVITRGATGISDINLDAAPQTIYNLQGVKLQQQFNQLPKGVYIVNGKKVIKK